ncbi:MAG: hypothetical protein QMB65_04815 [Vicingaceae bacterium]
MSSVEVSVATLLYVKTTLFLNPLRCAVEATLTVKSTPDRRA